ncbi:MAG: hypothetical protein IPO22_23350 [Anaerolineales bacterium]|jgi:hypothetical protein|nr:hypothetical protein [Anaerolineales bacterium]
MNGTSSLKTASKAFPTEWSLTWIEALLLIGGGVMAVVLHRALDMSLGLPGHHGIEWMAIMILGRASSKFRGAGTLTSIGASFASVLPFLHGDNPFTWIYYLLPGPVMDLAFRYLPRYANKLWFMVLLGGFAHMTKPIGQLTINLLTGWPIGSFRFGVVYPFASHLLFGMIGGLLGAMVVFGINRFSNKPNKG